jgi:cytochrome c oxidase subunit 2
VRFGSSIVDPHGSEASRIAGVWWLIFGLAALVYIVVAVLIVFALVRGRRHNAKSSSLREDAFIWVGGIAVPVLILFVVAVVTVHTTAALRNPSPRALHVTVTGHDWWWDVQYPGTAVRTANEIHIPVDRPVELRLLSTDVIHSLGARARRQGRRGSGSAQPPAVHSQARRRLRGSLRGVLWDPARAHGGARDRGVGR